MREKILRYSLEKNELLKKERGIGFEEIILALENGDLIDDIEHPNKIKYEHQSIFVILVRVKAYIYLVLYVEDEENIFLKTIIPSRKMTKRYKGNIA